MEKCLKPPTSEIFPNQSRVVGENFWKEGPTHKHIPLYSIMIIPHYIHDIDVFLIISDDISHAGINWFITPSNIVIFPINHGIHQIMCINLAVSLMGSIAYKILWHPIKHPIDSHENSINIPKITKSTKSKKIQENPIFHLVDPA